MKRCHHKTALLSVPVFLGGYYQRRWINKASEIIIVVPMRFVPRINLFRYTLTIHEYKSGASQPDNKQVLDISMRFYETRRGMKADASFAGAFYLSSAGQAVLLSDWYDLGLYTPELRRPVPCLAPAAPDWTISNGDVIVTNFEYVTTPRCWARKHAAIRSAISWSW